MKLENAKLVVAAGEDLGLEVELYEGYSGRCMYGKETTGVVGSVNDLLKCFSYAAARLAETDPEKVDDFLEDVPGRLDNMARDFIVY